MGGKGGTVGTVAFPLYIENTHRAWMGMARLDQDAPGTPQDMDTTIVDIMNNVMSAGERASMLMVIVAKADITEDEGFTLTNMRGISFTFKYKIGGSVTGEDYTIDINVDTTAEDVRDRTLTAINDSGQFIASTWATARIFVQQQLDGIDGNVVNTETVTNAVFKCPDFLFGTGISSPYANAAIYDPAVPLDKMQTKVDAYNALVTAITHKDDWGSITEKARNEAASTFTTTDISNIVTSILNSALSDAANTLVSIRADMTDKIDTLFTAAVTKVADIMDSAPITAMVAQFQQRAEASHLRIVSRYAGGMADINAVQGSAYLMGLALLESEHAQRVEEFVANLSYQIYTQMIPLYFQEHSRYVSEELSTFVGKFNQHLKSHVVLDAQKAVNRAHYINVGANEMSRLLLSKVDGAKLVASMQETVSKNRIIATSEEIKQGVMYDVEDWLWDLKVYQYGANVLSGASTGGQVLPEAPSQLSSTMSGVFGGAAVGSVIPGVGTVAGAIIGGIGGYLESGGEVGSLRLGPIKF